MRTATDNDNRSSSARSHPPPTVLLDPSKDLRHSPKYDVEAPPSSLHPSVSTRSKQTDQDGEISDNLPNRTTFMRTTHPPRDQGSIRDNKRHGSAALSGWARIRRGWMGPSRFFVRPLEGDATPTFRDARDTKVRGLKHFGLSRAASRHRHSGTRTNPSPAASAAAAAAASSMHSRRSALDGGGGGGGGSGTSVFSLPPLRSIEELEAEARQSVASHPLRLVILNTLAAIKVMTYFLITLETVVCSLVTTALVCYWYYTYQGDVKWNGGMLDFILLAFAVVSPISVAIGMAFTRRERALIALGDFRSCAYHLYLAHVTWDWPENGGRKAAAAHGVVSWVEHGDAVLRQLVGVADELSRLLSLPTSTRSRHRMTRDGRSEASRLLEVSYHLVESMCTQRMTRLMFLSERLKQIGLPAGEASRLRQYERFISYNMEQLRLIKLYRTPEALRSFARIFTLLLSPFYAPAYAQVARTTQSLAVGICFGILTAVCLSALFQGLEVLEDPFTAYVSLDGIDVREELEILHFAQLVSARQLVFPNAPARYPPHRRPALTRKPRKAARLDAANEAVGVCQDEIPMELEVPVMSVGSSCGNLEVDDGVDDGVDDDGCSWGATQIRRARADPKEEEGEDDELEDHSTLTSSSSSEDAWADRTVRIASSSRRASQPVLSPST